MAFCVHIKSHSLRVIKVSIVVVSVGICIDVSMGVFAILDSDLRASRILSEGELIGASSCSTQGPTRQLRRLHAAQQIEHIHSSMPSPRSHSLKPAASRPMFSRTSAQTMQRLHKPSPPMKSNPGRFSISLSCDVNLRHLNLAHNWFKEQELLQAVMLSGFEYLNLSATNVIGEIPCNASHLSSLRIPNLFVGLLFLAFGCRSKASMWAMEQSTSIEERVSSPFFTASTFVTTRTRRGHETLCFGAMKGVRIFDPGDLERTSTLDETLTLLFHYPP